MYRRFVFLCTIGFALRILQLTRSLVKGAAANPNYVRTMRSRRVTTPQALMTAAKATVRSNSGPNPNGLASTLVVEFSGRSAV